ncbi:oligosaccharide flippase family protein [Glaciimonas sp. Gout2]|uniref:oligosaccharide flippase family protein n=1 Tax=unclassified Glaciimonas TaxID=2644401 RepID=UPI002B23198D|nr:MULTISPECIES: oligosaccharide flippase family protein [unclassified Glaciimonas]MEB0010052.1 oligosaccharide flippase family protein [Glaciimonas sp. Cout2]MEB0081833.1 oligosaccharide flippase family protein [Glaciimonas sp. Gout2]
MDNSIKSASFWSFINSFATRGLSFAFFIPLTRKLGPGPLGVMALALAVGVFLDAVIDLGLSDQFVRHQDAKDQRFFSTVFWAQVSVAGIVGIIVAMFAPLLARVLHEPGLIFALRAVAIASFATAVGLSSISWLRRGLEYRAIAIRNVSATFVGGVVGIYMAWNGYALLAVLALHVINAVTGTLVAIYSAAWRPSLVFSQSSLKSVSRIAANTFLTRVLEAGMSRLDQIAVGAFFGASALGMYSLAVRLYDILFQLVCMPVASVMLPYLARYQAVTVEFRRHFLDLLHIVSLTAPPIFMLAALNTSSLLGLVFGPQWVGAGPYVHIIFGMGVVQAFTFIHTVAFAASGRTSVNLGVALFSALLWSGSLLLLPAYGVIFAAILWAMRSAIGIPIQMYFLKNMLDMRLRDYLLSLAPMFLALAGMVGVSFLILAIGERADVNPLILHFSSILAGGGVFVVMAILLSSRVKNIGIGILQNIVRRGSQA